MIDANEQVEKEQVAEVRKSTNETARIARSNLIFFLIAGLYIGLLVANTDDLLLLKAGKNRSSSYANRCASCCHVLHCSARDFRIIASKFAFATMSDNRTSHLMREIS